VERTQPTSRTPQDQRRSRRYPATLVIDLKHGSKVERLKTVDVSRHGLFVATERAPNERFLVQLTIHLPDGQLPATAFVSRSVRKGDRQAAGVGLQLFALAAASKQRWDQYIFHLAGVKPSSAAKEPQKKREGPPDAATFLIKLRDKARLVEFYRKNVRAGGFYLATPVIKEAGAQIVLILIHPETEQELTLLGKVVRVCRERPKGMEIKLQRLSEVERQEIKFFIKHGMRPAPEPSKKTPTAPPPAPPLPDFSEERTTGDISLDIVVDESALEESAKFNWNEISNREMIVNDFALSEYDTDGKKASPIPSQLLELEQEDWNVPILEPVEMPSSLERPARPAKIACKRCDHRQDLDASVVDVPFGLLAWRRPYWCSKCARFVLLLRLKPALERKRIADELSPDQWTMPIDLQLAFEIASLCGALPRCPTCSGKVRVTKAARSLSAAIERLSSEDSIELRDVRCPSCGQRGAVLSKG
jgi:Tfp pilus assembly protein PilZ